MKIYKKNIDDPKNSEEKMWIVYLTTYPPRECGLATFSADLINYGDELLIKKVETKVVALNTSRTKNIKYDSKVIFTIDENNKEEFISAAENLNEMPEVKIISIQHEFGLFGKNFGENIVFFLEKLEKPVAVTFHTVLPNPDAGMKAVMEKIINRSEKLIVMTELSKKILTEVYGAQVEKIKVIPHGIHPQLYSDTKVAKKDLNLEDKLVLTTFGLLSRGKGIEYAIQALPKIIEKYPNTIYLVLGETHPVVVESEGEVYREELIALATKLGVEKNIVFNNKYLTNEDLLKYLEATDIYLSLSQNPDQTVSGTLTYALGAGRAVISTSFMQAKEIVTEENGVLIGFNDSNAIANEVLKLFDDPWRLRNMGRAAYFHTRSMAWPNVSLSYMSVFSSLVPDISPKNKYLLPIKIDHLKKLTDDFGVFQFANLHRPDPKWGYTLDDNARALVALSWYDSLLPSRETEKLINIYLNFIELSSLSNGKFIDNFDSEKNANALKITGNSEDTEARALWALAVAGNSNINSDLREKAQRLFGKHLIKHVKISSPRAAALYIKTFAEYSSTEKNKAELKNEIEFYADFLVDLFTRTKEGEWQWFEESMTYSNALLPEALLIAYTVTENKLYFEVAKTTLDFLIEQSFDGEMCVPVGQAGWLKKGNKKELYDQQPEEVSALVLALKRMVSIDNDPKYKEYLMWSYDWFLGNNLSHQVVYTHFTGGTYDGIREGGVNLNQGSESTISYLLARLAMEIN
ncbi:MAG: glycosyltransferase [Candidatus Paceibacterota bacterium]